MRTILVPPPVSFSVRVTKRISTYGSIGDSIAHVLIVGVIGFNAAVVIVYDGAFADALIEHHGLGKVGR